MGSWNYRIGTYIFDFKERFPDNSKFHEFETLRYFCIISGYYDEDKKLISYGLNEKNILDGLESPEDLFDTIEKIRGAFEKPIINLDNFPNEYKEIDIDEKFYNFIKEQKDLDPEFNQILNDHMMDLIETNKEPKKKRFDG